ncbi:MAG: hypothetical protein K0S11_1432, partial [Gammaproteobacteria bacterium]|nr:hypothetical protein [Gammaproteobacteria bacterium]
MVVLIKKVDLESVFKLARLSQKGLIFENRSAVYIKYMSSVAQKIS